MNENTAIPSINLLSEIIYKFTPELISSNIDNLLQISLQGLQVQDANVLISSVHITLIIYPTAIELQKDLSQHVQLILAISATIFPNEGIISSVWTELSEPISGNYFSDEILSQLYQNMLIIAQNSTLSVSTRFTPIEAMNSCLEKFDTNMYSQYLDLIFQLSSQQVFEEQTLPNEFVNIIELSLEKLPKLTIYQMIKERSIAFLMQPDFQYHVVAIFMLGIILAAAPEAAYKDLNFLISTFSTALNENNDLISAAVCTALNKFDESFHSIDVFALEFLPRIIPLLISQNQETRLEANNAMHCLCGLIDTQIPGFFQAIWGIKDQVSIEENPGFIDYIATAIEKTSDFGDEEVDLILEYIQPIFTNPQYIDISTSFLIIVSTLITFSESLSNDLIPYTIPILDHFLCNYQDKNEDSIIDCMIYIGYIYKVLQENIFEGFNKYIQQLLIIANDENILERIRIQSISTLSFITKYTKNGELAKEIQPLVCDILSNEEPELIEIGIKATNSITQLLGPEDSKQLFLTLIDLCNDTDNSRIICDAIKPIVNLLKHAHPENVTCFNEKTYLLLNAFINGSFKFMNSPPLSGECDMILMTNIAYLITQLVKTNSPYINDICKFMLSIINIPNEPSIYAFIGAYSDAILYGTVSNELIQQLLVLIPNLISIAVDPSLQQNICYLFNILIQKQPSFINEIIQFVGIIWKWYENAKNQKTGYQLLISNIASLFLTMFSNGVQLDESILMAALSEIPPVDEEETVSMLQNATKILQNFKGISLETVKRAAKGFAEVLLMNEANLKRRNVNENMLQNVKQFLKNMLQNQQIVEFLQMSYQRSKAKLAKLQKMLL
ncbi:hypothetical protein GPJ56_005957 [Histomonas meleagridis]|uniref:uncharacterized protein n=1 Tax=Histomonas meleagridis TaxID=135588 RepID=UPI00355A42F4|nr:hypothetical protein GPJ56_005957 [Histomonas meleagridis]KAH0799363.1 hypothetical protein GO595_007764 [Histomonas meleagridis]